MKKYIQLFVFGLFLCITSFAAVVPVSTLTLQLKSGWNLVTLTRPMESTQSNVNNFLSLKPFTFDEKSQTYVFCARAEDLKPGVGYWIYSDKSQTVELALDTTQTVGQPTLKAGWNLVGMTDGASWPNSAVVIWAWKNGCFVQVNKTELQVGNAYWIYMN